MSGVGGKVTEIPSRRLSISRNRKAGSMTEEIWKRKTAQLEWSGEGHFVGLGEVFLFFFFFFYQGVAERRVIDLRPKFRVLAPSQRS